VSAADEDGKNTFMGYLIETNSENTGNVMSEHIGHENICIFTFRHIEGIGDIADDVQVGAEYLQTGVEHIDFEELLLLSCGFSHQDFVDKFEVSVLHHFHDPTQVEFYPALINFACCLNKVGVTIDRSLWYLARTT
jgi:hypothetical protein